MNRKLGLAFLQSNTIDKGKSGEGLAISFLKKNGFNILDKNYRCPFGEIDIIALDKKKIVFIEVKMRKKSHISPKYSVNFTKQQKIIKTALHYLKENKIRKRDVRFDVLSIVLSLSSSKKTDVELVKNAFTTSDCRPYYF